MTLSTRITTVNKNYDWGCAQTGPQDCIRAAWGGGGGEELGRFFEIFWGADSVSHRQVTEHWLFCKNSPLFVGLFWKRALFLGRRLSVSQTGAHRDMRTRTRTNMYAHKYSGQHTHTQTYAYAHESIHTRTPPLSLSTSLSVFPFQSQLHLSISVSLFHFLLHTHKHTHIYTHTNTRAFRMVLFHFIRTKIMQSISTPMIVDSGNANHYSKQSLWRCVKVTLKVCQNPPPDRYCWSTREPRNRNDFRFRHCNPSFETITLKVCQSPPSWSILLKHSRTEKWK